MALADVFNMFYVIKHNPKGMTELYISFPVMKGNLSLFDIITKASHTIKQQLVISLKNRQNLYNEMEIENLAYSPSGYNIADE